MTLKGLIKYGFYEEARLSSEKLVEHMYKTYMNYEPHSIWETYSPDEYKPAIGAHEGDGIVRKDFCGWSALGPISAYIEFVLGFYEVNAFINVVKWSKPDDSAGKIGIRNLHFGDVITDIEAEGDICHVITNKAYELEINGKSYKLSIGENTIKL